MQFAMDGLVLFRSQVTYKAGTPLIKGKKVASFPDEEEREMELNHYMTFLPESNIREKGIFVSGGKWTQTSQFAMGFGHGE